MCGGTQSKLKASALDRREFLQSALAATSLPLVSSAAMAIHNIPISDSNAPLMMRRAADTFLNSLTPDQRAKAVFTFDDEQRFDWHFIPRPRKGLPLKEMDQRQRDLGKALIGTGLSEQGLAKAFNIMSLDAVLREMEKGAGPVRDPEMYFLSLFGDSRPGKPWGWRLEGHHISVNFTLADDKRVSSTPLFFGANPAEVREGPRKGTRILAAEEDLGRSLIRSLDDSQRARAIVTQEAPREIISGNVRKAELLTPAGIQANKLSQKQAEILMSLLKEHSSRVAPDIAAIRMDKIRSGGFGGVSFAWAGGVEIGQPHYYRIQGPSFLIEYDNTQNNANHVHTVWRDFNGDFGVDMLAAHYKNDHR